VDLFEQRKIYTVNEITTEIKRTLEKFGIVWIQGEISNFKRHTSGHMYFALKDDRAQIKVAFFRNNNYLLKFKPEDGLEVLVRGRVSVYEPRGDYQLIVELMEPKGLGSLQLAFEQLKLKLRNEGLFDEAHKKPLPLLPRKIGIVTSPTGAAIRDMLHILQRRNASLHILLYPALVQGQGAAEQIAAGVRYFNAREDIDVIIVGRGGGSLEDLWAFNEETVARAIYASKLPVISAVGHEVDFTIADFVADLRAPTPSAAAEMVSGAREDLLATVGSLQGRLHQAMRLGIERRRLALERLALNRAFNIAPNMIRDFQQRFDEATLRMSQAMKQLVTARRHREQVARTRLLRVDVRQAVARRQEILVAVSRQMAVAVRACQRQTRARLELAAGRLNTLSPLAILQRGFAICRNPEGLILRDAASVAVDERVDVRLAQGELICRVEQTKQELRMTSDE
jgi:exodeoxyribonuclease VII large subunit